MIAWEMIVAQCLGKGAVIDLVILPANALFRHAGGAAGFKNAEGLTVICLWPPDFIRQIAQPFILEMRELRRDILKARDLLGRIPAGFLGPIEPKRTAGLGREMPLHNFNGMRIQLCLCLLHFLIQI